MLSAAAWAPSGSDIQPWHTYALTGAPLAELKKRAGERLASGDPWDAPEYRVYPPGLKSPYTVGDARLGRAPLDETITFVDASDTAPPWPAEVSFHAAPT